MKLIDNFICFAFIFFSIFTLSCGEGEPRLDFFGEGGPCGDGYGCSDDSACNPDSFSCCVCDDGSCIYPSEKTCYGDINNNSYYDVIETGEICDCSEFGNNCDKKFAILLLIDCLRKLSGPSKKYP